MSSEILGAGPENLRLFYARLKPHRSLTRRNFHVLMVIFIGASIFSSLPFVLLGAWPVAGFTGIDVAIFYFAFRANFRAACAYEDVEVTFFELMLAKVSTGGQRAEWRFNPAFVRLEREQHEEFGTQRLALVSRGKAVEIAAFLGLRTKRISPRIFPGPWPRPAGDRGFLDPRGAPPCLRRGDGGSSREHKKDEIRKYEIFARGGAGFSANRAPQRKSPAALGGTRAAGPGYQFRADWLCLDRRGTATGKARRHRTP